jgi:hypothetical protein
MPNDPSTVFVTGGAGYLWLAFVARLDQLREAGVYLSLDD